eukprot:gene1941-2376_t
MSFNSFSDIIKYITSLDNSIPENYQEKVSILNQFYTYYKTVFGKDQGLIDSVDTLIHLYLDINDLRRAMFFFEQFLTEPLHSYDSIETFHSILLACVLRDNFPLAVRFFRSHIDQYQRYLVSKLFVDLLKSLHSKGGAKAVGQLISTIRKKKMIRDDVYICLISFYLEIGDFAIAKGLYESYKSEGSQPNYFVYLKFFQKAVQTSDLRWCKELLKQTREEGVEPSFQIFQNIFELCSRLGETTKIQTQHLDRMVRQMYETLKPEEIGYLLFYNQVCGKVDIEKSIHSKLNKQSPEIATDIIDTVIHCYLMSNRFDKVLEWYSIGIYKLQLPPSYRTIDSIIEYYKKKPNEKRLHSFWESQAYDYLLPEVEPREYLTVQQIFDQNQSFLSKYSDSYDFGPNNNNGQPVSNLLSEVPLDENLESCIKSKDINSIIDIIVNRYFSIDKIPPGNQLIRSVLTIQRDEQRYLEFLEKSPPFFKPMIFNSSFYESRLMKKLEINDLIRILKKEDKLILPISNRIWNVLLYKLLSENHIEMALQFVDKMLEKKVTLSHYDLFSEKILNVAKQSGILPCSPTMIADMMKSIKLVEGDLNPTAAYISLSNCALFYLIQSQQYDRALNFFITHQKDRTTFDLAVDAYGHVFDEVTNDPINLKHWDKLRRLSYQIPNSNLLHYYKKL